MAVGLDRGTYRRSVCVTCYCLGVVFLHGEFRRTSDWLYIILRCISNGDFYVKTGVLGILNQLIHTLYGSYFLLVFSIVNNL